MLLGFHKTLISEYPYFQGLNKKTLYQDSSHLNVYLTYHLPDVWNFTRIYEVKVETTLCEAFLNLFSDLFPSEALFRIWDLIILDGIID